MGDAARRSLSLVLALLVVGCAVPVRIDSEPSGARILIEGSMVGYTPVELHLPATVRRVTLQRDGYQEVSGVLRRRFDRRSLVLLPAFPLLFVPAISTRLEHAYSIALERGDGHLDVGVLEAVADGE